MKYGFKSRKSLENVTEIEHENENENENLNGNRIGNGNANGNGNACVQYNLYLEHVIIYLNIYLFM